MRAVMDRVKVAASIALAASVLAASAGCRGDRTDNPPRQYFPGLMDQPKYKAQAESRFFSDRRAMREPPSGVVAFGRAPHLEYGSGEAEREEGRARVSLQRTHFLRNDDRVFRGIENDDTWVERIPIRGLYNLGPDDSIDEALVMRLIETGRKQYNIFCLVCHGGAGAGDGPVGKEWSAPLPNFHDDRFQPGADDGSDGYLFHVIRNGVANAPGAEPALRMPAYGDRVNEHDAWAIVAYIRSLQRARGAPIDLVPDAERERLERRRPATQTGADAGHPHGDDDSHTSMEDAS
ncbi:MAG: cytochrome c [Phycisphaeraceae bacterium]|nr:MAG: cytochrome c [Phycisphaeraceae bacterium]